MENETKTSDWQKPIIWLVVVVLVIWGGYSIFGKKTPTEVIKIGAVLSLTGNNAGYGQPTQRGMELALEELNKNGEKVNIIYEDDKSATESAVSAFQKLTTIDKVPIVIGFMSSSGVLATAPVANSSRVVLLSTLAGSDEIKDAGDYVFRIREKSATHGEEMAKYARNILGFKNVVLYYANSANGISYADFFKKEFTTLGGQIVFEGKYIEKTGDFRSDLIKIKVAKPEAVYIAGVAPDMAQILIQAKDLELKTKWLASAGAENPKLIEIAKNNAEGLIFTTPAFNPDQASELIQKFTKAYKEKYNELPNFAAANGYDGVMAVYDVIKKYGNNAEKIKSGLYATQNYLGVGGAFSFDEFGEVQKPIMFKVVENGQFVKLEK